MKNLLLLAFAVFVVWKLTSDEPTPITKEPGAISVEQFTQEISRPSVPVNYDCDGRQHCSQMTSCEEATYFIRHCPNTKMDGDNDGVPCERQWC
jgi:Excalibur calcium-binding domain